MESIDAGEFTALWALPTLTYGAGDLLTTMTVASAATAVTEVNPVVVAAFAHGGVAGLVALKLAVLVGALALCVGAARADDRLSYYGTPALLAVLGAFLTVYNLRILAG
ncbi:MAG: hypothetical protein ABEJ43_05895 [Haloferacaceae archaeon]